MFIKETKCRDGKQLSKWPRLISFTPVPLSIIVNTCRPREDSFQRLLSKLISKPGVTATFPYCLLFLDLLWCVILWNCLSLLSCFYLCMPLVFVSALGDASQTLKYAIEVLYHWDASIIFSGLSDICCRMPNDHKIYKWLIEPPWKKLNGIKPPFTVGYCGTFSSLQMVLKHLVNILEVLECTRAHCLFNVWVHDYVVGVV